MASQTVRLTPSACAGCLQLVSTLVQLQLTMQLVPRLDRPTDDPPGTAKIKEIALLAPRNPKKFGLAGRTVGQHRRYARHAGRCSQPPGPGGGSAPHNF